MRIRLVGWAGDRPPVPDAEPVVPIDPNPDPPPPEDFVPPDPMFLVLENGVPFHKADYQALGYNRFDVMCIGGAGGRAGGYYESIPYTAHPAGGPDPTYMTLIRTAYGGGGGGGGLHRIKGRLSLLPASCAVVVGAAGADGAFNTTTGPAHDAFEGTGWMNSYPSIPTGGNGGASSFGGVICKASGGLGGTNGPGAGGVGNTVIAGGGGSYATDGTWDGVIGKGGCGGNGGFFRTSGSYPSYNVATAGSKGSYSISDPSTSGAGGDAGPPAGFDYQRLQFNGSSTDVINDHLDISSFEPGAGGGAKPYWISGENRQYGSKAESEPGTGLVVIGLSYVLV